MLQRCDGIQHDCIMCLPLIKTLSLVQDLCSSASSGQGRDRQTRSGIQNKGVQVCSYKTLELKRILNQ